MTTPTRTLRPHAATADDLLARWTPSPAQGRTLTAWVTERPWRTDPHEHTVSAPLDTWAETLGQHWPDQLPRTGTQISRGQVFQVAADARASGRWLQLLAAAFAWGYGDAGYGPSRFTQIAAHDHLADTLTEAVAALDSQGGVAAYERLRRAVPRLGPAFFTKFLYFAATPDTPGPAPLILDARVAGSLRALTTGLTRSADTPHADDLSRWLWRGPVWTSHRYGVYLDLADRVTGHLHERSNGTWPARADVLELALFDTKLRMTGVWVDTSAE